ncbi:hypothetical protein ACH436_06410 [Isoptericola sp. NPDC019693]|uniref:hypothetical protein n=1 Tax=Isoptericola sp. NPDC019693 TaxID=3364009 RepID=UPI00378C9086
MSATQMTTVSPAQDYWWAGNPDERYWMEIRRRAGIGIDLWSPDRNENGGVDPWYELLASVRAGEVVYHYSAREQRIVGRSVAARDAEHRAHDHSYRVALKNFEPIDGAVNLDAFRSHADELYDLRDKFRQSYSGPLYLPFQFTTDRTQFRPMSNYFTKLPQAFLQVLFPESNGGSETTPIGQGEEPLDEAPTQTPPGVAFLDPFKPKADTDYVVEIAKAKRTSTRRHETLVNNFASWLIRHGFEPGKNAAIDLGLLDPPVIFEAKTVGNSWADAIRQAVSQLYEYRYFKVGMPEAELIFLSEKPLPAEWLMYLEKDRSIGAVWPVGAAWHFSPRASAALGNP